MRKNLFFKKHPKLTLIIFNLVILLVIFIVFEVILRIFTPTWLEYRMEYLNINNSKGYGSDADWKVKFKDNKFYSFLPNSAFKIYHYEYENTVHINSLGGRETEANQKADSNNLIPFIGDSYVMGVGVEDTETIVSLTRKMTNNNFLNLGISGSSMPIQRDVISMRYNELGKPAVVIFGFCLGNDFDDIMKFNSAKTDTGKVARSNEELSNTGFLWKLNEFINHNWLLRKLYVLQFIKQKMLNIRNNKKAKDMYAPFYLFNLKNTAYINQASLLIDKEVEALSKEPYHSIVVLIPDKYQISTPLRNAMSRYYNLDEKDLDPLMPNKLLIKALDKYKISYIDPTACLVSRQAEGQLYYKQDNHFTKFGNRIISECIGKYLDITLRDYKTLSGQH